MQWLDIVPGGQTVRRGGAGPVRSLLGGKPHRSLRFSLDLRLLSTGLDGPLGCVPDLYLPPGAVPARGRQALAVGAERHADDVPDVPVQDGELLAGCGVPDADGIVLARRRQPLAVGAERDTVDAVFVPAERNEF